MHSLVDPDHGGHHLQQVGGGVGAVRVFGSDGKTMCQLCE